MSKLKKCLNCKNYTLKEVCDGCGKEVKDAHYKFLKTRDAPKARLEFFK